MQKKAFVIKRLTQGNNGFDGLPGRPGLKGEAGPGGRDGEWGLIGPPGEPGVNNLLYECFMYFIFLVTTFYNYLAPLQVFTERFK